MNDTQGKPMSEEERNDAVRKAVATLIDVMNVGTPKERLDAADRMLAHMVMFPELRKLA